MEDCCAGCKVLGCSAARTFSGFLTCVQMPRLKLKAWPGGFQPIDRREQGSSLSAVVPISVPGVKAQAECLIGRLATGQGRTSGQGSGQQNRMGQKGTGEEGGAQQGPLEGTQVAGRGLIQCFRNIKINNFLPTMNSHLVRPECPYLRSQSV